MRTHEREVECPNPLCMADNVLEFEIDPGEGNYGADADGNRGMDVPAYLIPVQDEPKCSKCDASLKELSDGIIESWEPAEPSYDED